MNIEKIIVLACLIITVLLSAVVVCYFCKQKKKTIGKYALLVCAMLMLLCCLVVAYRNLSPFDQSVRFEYYAEIKLAEGNELMFPIPWFCEYEAFGFYAESRLGLGEGYAGAPEMDWDKYTYIVCFGQKLTKLTYNAWETVDVPVHTGAFLGHAEFEEDFYPNSIFIYRIRKIRIDNE